jgi:DNA-binding transcriptional MocR family regulator
VAVHYQISGHGASQIAASVEAGIRSGAFPPGTTLPAVRVLAATLGVSPATTSSAYQSLRQRGLIETAGRNGTRVRHRPPVTSRVAQRLPVPPGLLDLSSGGPDPRLLPALGPRLRRLAATASGSFGYTGAGAWPGLVIAARRRLAADGVPAVVPAGVPVRASMATAAADPGVAITVASGALDAIERLLSAHLRPGDRVGVEDPAWANLIDLVAALGMKPIPIAVDAEGPTVDGLIVAIRAGITAVVVTSRAHNPTGAAVSATRATALRTIIASVPDLLVIEDDHAAELTDVPLAPLGGAGRMWAFVRSVSKPYGPDLRVAIVAGDEASIARVEGRMRLGAGWVSTLLQRLVVELWHDDAVAAVVAKARREYAVRREALLDALAVRGIAALGQSGINVWIPLDDEPAAVAVLRDRGFAVAPGSLYRQATPPGIRITTATLAVADIPRLADAVAAATGQRPDAIGTVR